MSVVMLKGKFGEMYSETCLKQPPMGHYELAIIDRWSLGVVSCVMQPLHNWVPLESE